MLTFCIPQSPAQIKVQITLAILRQTDASQAERCAPESEETQSRASSLSMPCLQLHLLGVEVWGLLS